MKFWCVRPNFDRQRHDTTTPLYENPTLAHRNQLAISMFLIPHVQGSFFMRKCRKSGSFVKFWCVKPNLDRQTRNTTTPLYINQTLAHRHQFSISIVFCFIMCKALFSWENTEKKGDLWNIHGWSQILTGKTHDTTTPLYANQILAHRH